MLSMASPIRFILYNFLEMHIFLYDLHLLKSRSLEGVPGSPEKSWLPMLPFGKFSWKVLRPTFINILENISETWGGFEGNLGRNWGEGPERRYFTKKEIILH